MFLAASLQVEVVGRHLKKNSERPATQYIPWVAFVSSK